MIPSAPFLCYVTDESPSPVDSVRKVLEGGASMIQLRHKSASGEQLYLWAKEMQDLCRMHNAVFIVNDRVDIALAADADGVHLGQEDLPAREARKLLGPKKIMGISASTLEEALRAEKDGADYVGLGHIFETSSKEKHSRPLGPEALAAVRAAAGIPIVAIGGINRLNAARTIASGASGIAVIAAISRAPEPERAARELVSILQHQQ